MIRNYSVGELIICRGRYTPVVEIRIHEPGTHRALGSPIYDHLHATEYVTARDSRWWGKPATKEDS